jgi:cob(I)alamin adenosyltransferase
MTEGKSITTGGGDRGETSLADGRRVPKNNPRVVAYGTVDELNCLLGLARCEALPAGLDGELLRLQQELFDLGADLAAAAASGREPAIGPAAVARLEVLIAAAEEELPPLAGFILPGGSRAAGLLHLARAVARRAERAAIEARQAEQDGGNTFSRQVLVYLNRLSDLLFIWARLCNDGGRADILRQSAGAP